MRRHRLATNADLYVLPAERFKTIHLFLAFRQVLADETATLGALLPRVLRRGTRRWPDFPSLTGHLEDLYGAALEATASKVGDQQVIESSFSCPGPAGLPDAATARDLAGQGTDLLVEMFLSPAGPDGRADPGEGRGAREDRGRRSGRGLREDYVREEKDGLAREIAALADDRMSYAHYRMVQEMCRGEPYAHHSLGRAADLEAIDPAGLDRFRGDLVATAPLVAYLAGPVDERTVDRVAGALGAFMEGAGPGGREPAASGRRAIPSSRPHAPPPGEKELFEQADVEQGRLVVGLQTGVVAGDEAHPAQVLYNGLLGGFVHSRLFRRIREEAGLAYYAWSRSVATKGLILISCGIQERSYARAVGLIRRELESLARGDFTDAEFEATRNSVLAASRAQLDSPNALLFWHLERVAVGEELEEIAPWRSLERVKADDVREFGPRPVLDTIYLLGRTRPSGEP